MATLDQITEELKNLNETTEQMAGSIEVVNTNVKRLLSSFFGTAESKIDYADDESPLEKEKRIEKDRIEKQRFDSLMDMLNSMLSTLNKAVRPQTGEGIFGTLGKLLGLLPGLLLGGVAALLPVIGNVLFGPGTLRMLSGLWKNVTRFILSPIMNLVLRSFGTWLPNFISMLFTVAARFLNTKGLSGLAKYTLLIGKFITGPFRFIFRFVEGMIDGFTKAAKWIAKSPVFRMLGKSIGIILLPLRIILTLVETIRGMVAGYKVDGIKGAIIGAISGFVNFITFGLIPFDDIYKSLKAIVTGVVKSWNLAAEGKVWEAIKVLGNTVLSFLNDVVNMVVKGVTTLVSLITEWLGFEDAAASIRDFGKNFNVGKKIKEALQNIGVIDDPSISTDTTKDDTLLNRSEFNRMQQPVAETEIVELEAKQAVITKKIMDPLTPRNEIPELMTESNTLGYIINQGKAQQKNRRFGGRATPLRELATQYKMQSRFIDTYGGTIASPNTNYSDTPEYVKRAIESREVALPTANRFIQPMNENALLKSTTKPNFTYNAPQTNLMADVGGKDSGKPAPIVAMSPVRNSDSSFNRLTALDVITGFLH